MYTVVFVEDEYLTREEISRTTDWNSMGLALAGTASDGISGEKMIHEIDPDIVITDIRLPGQDGLEMLSHCQVSAAVILSGHTDYQYMKRAIRLGVMDYLQKPVDDEELEATLREAVSRLDEENNDIERIKSSIDDSAMTIKLPESAGNIQIEAIIKFIKTNFSKPIGLVDAAQSVNLSESHLSRLFKEITGVNYLQYLNAYRINQSLGMLCNPRLSIGDISLACGFPNPGYFAKIFRKYIGMTPTQFRDTQQL